jgi:hypothetical protein
MTGRPSDASFSDGPAPWDIGQPQPASATGWTIADLSPERIHTRFHKHGAPVWRTTVQRI